MPAGATQREARLSSGIAKPGESKAGAPAAHLVTLWGKCPECEAVADEMELRNVGPSVKEHLSPAMGDSLTLSLSTWPPLVLFQPV